ncbi:MAG: class I SAM-dependent methyltransferase [Candidatus Limnocylindrales bacterium]
MSDGPGPWASGAAYDAYIGRWSRIVAADFLDWLAVPAGRRWLDVGCGTGALTSAILGRFEPVAVVGIDPSPAFLDRARQLVVDPRASFREGSADATGLGGGVADIAVAGLVLNFVPDIGAALREMCRVVGPGGRVAGYVWDYGGEMQLLRRFWQAAIELDPSVTSLNQGEQFPVAAEKPFRNAFAGAGLDAVEVQPIDITMRFNGFDDLWAPFLGGTGPAPAYAGSLASPALARLRDRFRDLCPPGPDGSIALLARTWAARGRVPRETA